MHLSDLKNLHVGELLEMAVKNEVIVEQAIIMAGEYKSVTQKLLPRMRELKLSPNSRIRDAATRVLKEIDGG